MVPAPAATGSPANLLETQILGCHKRPSKSETLGWGLAETWKTHIQIIQITHTAFWVGRMCVGVYSA